jgi:hypothetical protein
MIISIDFMLDFYGLDKQKLSDCIPFYCSKHNRLLISEYKTYLGQIEQCLELKDTTDVIYEDARSVYSESNWNITNLSHPEFNFVQNIEQTTTASNNIRDELYKVDKPSLKKKTCLGLILILVFR